MKEFFMHYISPSSPHRAKLSVHLIAQKQAKEPTLEEKKTQMSSIIAAIFKAESITPNDDALKSRIDAITSNADIPSAISAHLKEDLGLSAEQVDKVADEATAAMGLADAGLSGEVVNADEKMTVTGVQAGSAKEPVLITDVHAWKAGLQMSTGVRPIRNLEEFMEGAPKL
jgi:insulysin